jgi:hypothetical protein
MMIDIHVPKLAIFSGPMSSIMAGRATSGNNPISRPSNIQPRNAAVKASHFPFSEKLLRSVDAFMFSSVSGLKFRRTQAGDRHGVIADQSGTAAEPKPRAETISFRSKPPSAMRTRSAPPGPVAS